MPPRRARTKSSIAARGRGIKQVPEALPFTLRTYRRLAIAATPLLPLLASYRMRRGKEHSARLRERRGQTDVPRPDAPLIWMHAASVGELMSVIPIVEHVGSN